MPGTILLVDDDDGVRRTLSEALILWGYDVLQASSGIEALAIAATCGRRIELLLTDVCMPGMRGPELAMALRKCDPSLGVLYMSGYADFDLQPAARLLQKPFRMEALRSEVEARMGGGASRKPVRGDEARTEPRPSGTVVAQLPRCKQTEPRP